MEGTVMEKLWLYVILLTVGIMAPTIGYAGEGLPPYYGVTTLPAQPLPWTASVYADFGALLSKLGVRASLDASSVRVTNVSGEELPTRFQPDKEDPNRGLVRWYVPAMPKADGRTEFHVCFAGQSDRKWESPRAEEVGLANLIPNGELEQMDTATRKPLSWVYAQGANSVTDPKLAHSGNSCVRIDPFQDEKSGRWQNSTRTPGIPGVVVEGNRSYSFRYWARTEGTVPASYRLVSAAQVYWYRADQSYIRHDNCAAGLRRDTDWTEIADALQSPPDARYAMLTISFYSSKGTLYLDDFSIVPVQRPQLDSAQSADGSRKVALRVTDARVRRFDFGKDSSAVWPGFIGATPQTDYSEETGYGWVGTARPYAILRALPDDLVRDFVVPPGGSQFALDLPDGNYSAWFLIGDTGLGDTIIPTYVNWSIKVSGQEVLSYKPDARSWYDQVIFRHFNEWWEPDVDVYDRFVAPCFVEKTAPFSVQGGQARFEIASVPLCALVIYPSELDRDIAAEFVRLRADRKRSVPAKFEPSQKESPQGITAADQKRGYALFSRDMSKPILPGSAPQEGESISRLSGYAAPGEYETFNFSVYPLKDLGAVSVSVSDLSGPGGGKLTAARDIETGVVRYVESSLSDKEYRYTIAPGPIQPRNPMPVSRDVTTTWCLRCRVPDDAKPGVYRGRIHIAPAQSSASNLELVVRVVPIKLEPTPITAGLYHFDKTYWYINWWRRCFEDKDGWLRDQTFQHEWDDFRTLQEYGLNSLAFCDDLRGQVQQKPDGELVLPDDHRVAQWMDLYAKAGMGPMPWYGFSAVGTSYLATGMYGKKTEQFSPDWEQGYRSLISWTTEEGKQRGWPEVIFYLSDELSNEGATGAEMGRKLVQLTKGIPGIRTISSMNGPWEKVMLPGLKIAMPNHAFPITDQTVEAIRKVGCDLWMYNISNSRVVWGYYLWKMGATGRFQWFHRYAITDPWNTFDGDSAYNVTWVTPGKPLPTLELVQIREGIDDLRYVRALEKAMDEARKSGKPEAVKAVEAAQKDLDDLRNQLPDNVKLLIGEMDPKEAGKPAIGNFANCRFLDRQRWLIASHILEIQKAMGR